MKIQPKILTILFLTLLIISSANTFLIPNTTAAEINSKDLTILHDAPEKALSILNDVVGVDNQKYTADQRPISNSEYFGATQKNVDFYLTAPDSSCRVVTSYVNDQLYKIYFSDYKGEISLKYKESNAVDTAKGFLGRLENQTKAPLYQ